MIGPEEVQRIARLAKLALEPSEVEAVAGELGRILAYVELLEEAGDGPADEVATAAAVAPPLRPDEPADGLPRAEILDQAPGADGETFRVPPVLDDGGTP